MGSVTVTTKEELAAAKKAKVTMGTSLGVTSVGLVAAAATTGTSFAAIIAASSIGIALIVAVYKDYRVIEARTGFISLSLKK